MDPGRESGSREAAQALVNDVLTIRQLWRRTQWIKLALVFGAIVALGGVIGGLTIYHTAQTASTNSRKIAEVTASQKHSFCLTQGLFIGLDTTQNRDMAPDKVVFDHQFSILRQSYVEAGCSPPLPPSPPGSHQTP